MVEPSLWIIAASLIALKLPAVKEGRKVQSYHSDEKQRPDSEDRMISGSSPNGDSDLTFYLDDDNTLISARNSRNTTHSKFIWVGDRTARQNSTMRESRFGFLTSTKNHAQGANYPNKVYARNMNDSGWDVESHPPQISIPEGLAAPFGDRFSRSSWWNLSNIGRQSNRQSVTSHDDSISFQIGEFPQPSRTTERYRGYL
jgi:hypothetical protein